MIFPLELEHPFIYFHPFSLSPLVSPLPPPFAVACTVDPVYFSSEHSQTVIPTQSFVHNLFPFIFSKALWLKLYKTKPCSVSPLERKIPRWLFDCHLLSFVFDSSSNVERNDLLTAVVIASSVLCRKCVLYTNAELTKRVTHASIAVWLVEFVTYYRSLSMQTGTKVVVQSRGGYA